MSDNELLDSQTGYRQIWSGMGKTLPLDYSIDKASIIYLETNESILISDAAAIEKPEYIIITLGIENGVAYCGEQKFKEYYLKLLDALQKSSPASKIILQSIFPVSDGYEEKNSFITNEKIERANLWIEEMAEEKGLRYLDTASVLKNKGGSLNENFNSGDGLHLNKSGYLTVLDYIRAHGYK